MRARRALQRSFFDVGYPNHETGRALERISTLLDGHPEFLDWISADVDRGRPSRRGRAGLPCEVILRCGILKQLWQVDYRDLEFALLDSASAKHFARVNPLRPPTKFALQKCIGAVGAEVWERINRVLMEEARGGKVEGGRTVRIDSRACEWRMWRRHPASMTSSGASAQASRRGSRISSGASAFAGATGRGLITSGPTSGRRSLPTTWRCWPAAR